MEETVARTVMLKRVFLFVVEHRRYRGDGWMWGVTKDETKLQVVIDGAEHIPILRSWDFCRELFGPPPIRAESYVGSHPPGPLHLTLITGHEYDDAHQHHEALQTESDPLAYCYAFLNA